ncbi:Hpt domain-containing protein [Anditalea andensis]|uniref:HPt domain-containing protein n=1 Tax=Anditalea andensis TaxID=1048983 RepID=A0A074L3Z8_9BACT|nr:Hpt domain-containing protein [Anditalea andensis]KEO75155.1 hypothetical protein EL17_05660 [Anditalea andensis]
MDVLPTANKNVFDFAMLGGLQDDEEFVLLLKNIFVTTVPDKLDQLSTAIRMKDWDTVTSAAHYLKSNFGNIQSKDAYKAVKLIEEYAIQRTNLDQLEDLFLKVTESIDPVMSCFHKDINNDQ